jgi:hypothetical protein
MLYTSGSTGKPKGVLHTVSRLRPPPQPVAQPLAGPAPSAVSEPPI